MSEVQKRTKAVLLPLLLREDKVLAQTEQEILAIWATMFSMVYERSLPENAASTASQRVSFMSEQKPPKNWMFWCAPFDGLSSPAFLTGFGSENRGPAIGDDGNQVNKAALTMCGAGGVTFAVLSVNTDQALQVFSQFVTTLIEGAGFVRLWPTAGVPIRVTERRLSPLTFRDFGAIRNAIVNGLRFAAANRK